MEPKVRFRKLLKIICRTIKGTHVILLTFDRELIGSAIDFFLKVMIVETSLYVNLE